MRINRQQTNNIKYYVQCTIGLFFSHFQYGTKMTMRKYIVCYDVLS